MTMAPIDYLFDICSPGAGACSGESFLENLLEWADAREHLEELMHADPASLSDELLAEVKQIIEIYEYLIPEMMRRDAGDADEDVDDRVVYQHSPQLLEVVASINTNLARQHAALVVEFSVRGQETDPDDDTFWNALVNFFPSDDCWEWPDI